MSGSRRNTSTRTGPVKGSKHSTPEMRAYIEKCIEDDKVRNANIDQLEANEKAVTEPAWAQAAPAEVQSAKKFEVPVTEEDKLARSGLPNDAGWVYAANPDDMSPYEGFDALHTGTPSHNFDAQPIDLSAQGFGAPQHTHSTAGSATRQQLAPATRGSGGFDRTILGAASPDVAFSTIPFEVTTFEIFCFMPRLYRWKRSWLLRLIRNGWSLQDMANAINYVRELTKDAGTAFKMENLSNAVRANDIVFAQEWHVGETNMPPPTWVTNKTKGLPKNELLVRLADEVKHMPTGADAGPLTKCIEYAQQHNDQLQLSDIPAILALDPSITMLNTNGRNIDKEAHTRWLASGNNIKRDERD